MQVFAQAFPTIAVAMIYCLWHRVHVIQLRRTQTLRERVAYMLWCAATEAD
jgi:hypothetical protein